MFYLNGKRVEIENPQPEQTLLQYLRSSGVRLTGTKLGCGEGGCGACSVMISYYDHKLGRPVHRSINACLALLGSVEGTHITTVEGLGNTRDGLHPIQERIARLYGSQCGFCTPGIVMALYSFLREHPKATAKEIEESLDGNLCRCTGYRPLLDAAKTFASDSKTHSHSNGVENGHSNGAADSSQLVTLDPELKNTDLPPGARICPSSGKPCFCTIESSTEEVLAHTPDPHPKELIFPPPLVKHRILPLRIQGENCIWYRPLTLQGLLEIKAKHPEAKIVMGSSELTIEARFKNSKFPVLVAPTHIPELSELKLYPFSEGETPFTSDGSAGIQIGASVTLTNLQHFLQAEINKRPQSETRTLTSVLDQLRWFAGHQIRNGACVGGNIATASPISDLNPVWMAAGTVITLASLEVRDGLATVVYRQVPAKKFFIGYRRTDMKPNEVIAHINIPFTDPLEFVGAYKQARRREDDIAIVTCAFRVKFEQQDSASSISLFKVKEASFAFGGMAPLTVSTPATEQYLIGRTWTKDTLEECYKLLEKDLPLAPNAPGGMIQYRRSLTTSFFFRFYCAVGDELERTILKKPQSDFVAPNEKSALAPIQRQVSRGQQTYHVNRKMIPVTAPTMHQSATKQVTGEAIYVDDMKNPPHGLYAAFVCSTRVHARILSIDPSKALAMPGVHGFFTAKDIPGENDIGPVLHDEELFAKDEVMFHGHAIGVVVAESHQLAVQASKAVEVFYEDLPSILTIPQAIAADSFFPSEKPQILRGDDVDTVFPRCDHVAEGEFMIGGQEHFYLEVQGSLVEPIEGNEMVIHSSTQNPTKTQAIVGRVLGIPQNMITAKMKRMGGGFGGKETRSVYVSAAAAVAAYHLRRPVRMILDRDVDMATSGGRHPFFAKYKVGFSKQGKIEALDVNIYSQGGFSMDLSASVLHRCMTHVDNAYYIPHMRVTGRVCKTNTPTNTAFRGFGGPQGMIIAENYIDHIARVLNVDAMKIREENYYQAGQTTSFGQVLDQVHLQRLHSELTLSAEMQARQQEIDRFNQQNRWKKRGLAYVPTRFGMSFTARFMNQAGALVHVYTDGTVLVTHGGTEMGQGLHTKIIQIAAQAFGISVDKVHISETSTDKVPNSSPTAASASSDMYGMATLEACNKIMNTLNEFKKSKGLDPQTDFPTLVRLAYFDRIPLSATGFYATPDLEEFKFDGKPAKPFAYFTYGAAVSEVEIDVLTGDFQVLRADVLMDIGNSLNPTIDVGQVEGAFVQGMGWCTIEEVVQLDNGVMFTRGPSTYKIPSFNDVPVDFRVTLLADCPNPKAVHGSKGIGEPPLFLATSVFWAIKNAVYSARKDSLNDDKFFRFDSPATCERIRIACEDSFTRQFAL